MAAVKSLLPNLFCIFYTISFISSGLIMKYVDERKKLSNKSFCQNVLVAL